jgi:alkyl hydroperoxide reductase subunit AhpC
MNVNYPKRIGKKLNNILRIHMELKHMSNNLEKACSAWWDIQRNNKQVATIPWKDIPEAWKKDYQERMQAALDAIKEQNA